MNRDHQRIATCGARHVTGVVCELPRGHAENHRGEDSHCSAQWPVKVGDSTPPATPVEPRVDAVAREVAKALMTNGLGERCDRLALLLGGSPIGAGWSLSGATAQIRETLEQEGYVLDRMAEADRRARASHPSAVSGEGERLKEQAAAYRAIALDALARWQGEDDHSDDNQRRNRSARSRATLRHRICAVDDTVRASTPTPGTPR